MLDEEHIKTKVWLVIDNLSVHHSKVLKAYYVPFHVLFLPPYTSQANPQEHVWAVVKRELAVHFARIKHKVSSQSAFEAEVDYILSQVKNKHMNSTFIERMKQYLAKQLL